MKVKISKGGIYTFNYDINQTGTNIDFVDADNSNGGGDVEVVPVHDGRYSVLKFDSNNVAADYGAGDHTGFDLNPTGTIEFLYQYFGADSDFNFDLYDGATRLVKFRAGYVAADLRVQYDIGAGLVTLANGLSPDTWYIIRIDTDTAGGANGDFDAYVYTSAYVELFSTTSIQFENNSTTVDKIIFTQQAPGHGVTTRHYIDSFGITGEGYTIGDIQNAEIDVSSFVNNPRIYDGIIPFKKRLTFTCHSDNESSFNEDDTIDVLDDSDNVLFAGIIESKAPDQNNVYHFTCDGFANELFDRTYDKSYTTNDTDTKLKDMIDNGLKFIYRSSSIVGTTTTYSYEYNRSCAYLVYLARFLEREVIYIEPDGKMVSVAYDGITASGKSWTLYDGNQDAFLIDHPAIRYGYSKGNTGISSVSVRYKNDVQVTRPSSPSETFRQKRLNEWRDPKLQAATEVNQLGDNLYSIFSADTIFISLRIKDEGWLQPGETVQIQNTNQITITQDNFLLVEVEYDPLNDIYIKAIFSDNIITHREFRTSLDTSRQQIHTAAVQSFENQADIAALKVTIQLQMILSTAATWITNFSGEVATDSGEFMVVHLRITPEIDASKDIVFTWSLDSDAADATTAHARYVGAIKTDMSEANAWNIESNVAFNVDMTTADRNTTFSYTLAAANYEVGDLIRISQKRNQANRTRWTDCTATYTRV